MRKTSPCPCWKVVHPSTCRRPSHSKKHALPNSVVVWEKSPTTCKDIFWPSCENNIQWRCMHHRHQSSNIFMWGLAKVSGGKAGSPPAPFLADFLAAPVAPPQADRFFGAMTWPRRSCPGIQGCVKKGILWILNTCVGRNLFNINMLREKVLWRNLHSISIIYSLCGESQFQILILWRTPTANLDFAPNPKFWFCNDSPLFQILILWRIPIIPNLDFVTNLHRFKKRFCDESPTIDFVTNPQQ